jgi:flavodoxin
MVNEKVLIICESIHHGNTRKVAEAMANVLDAEIKRPSEVDISGICEYDLLGFGSGIYNRKHHISLFTLLDQIECQNHKRAFVFSTSTVLLKKLHTPIKEKLIDKGFIITGEYFCKGFMSYSFTRYIFGGLNRGRPNKNDLKKAEDFAINLRSRGYER